MLAMIYLFEHLPAAIVGLCSLICMGVQIITKSQIPEVKLFSTQCKVHIVWDLCDFLLLSVILWLFIAKPGKNGWQGKDDSCFLKLAPALMDNDNTPSGMLQELSVLLSCQGVQGVEGGMWKLKLIMKNDIVSGEEESLACFVEIFQWLHCIIHVLYTMNQHIKKKKEKSHTEETSQKCAPRIMVSCRHKISYWGNKLLFSDTALFPPAKLSNRVEFTASKQGNVSVPLTSEKYYCNCLVFLLQWNFWKHRRPSSHLLL